MQSQDIVQSLQKLKEYIISESYQGFDPYDTLLSPLFKYPVFRARIARFGAQQVCRRIPFSFRKPLLITKGLNPVTLGLAVQAYGYLLKTIPGSAAELNKELDYLLDALIKVKSNGYSGICWGYDFDWEHRYTRINAYVPTSVATGIITNGLFEYYLISGNKTALEMCRDAGKFIMNDLRKSFEGDLFCYSYSPVDRQFVFNASMKAARLLSQIYSVDKDENLKSEARKAVEYVMKYQRKDGSWAYANHDARTWSDNYHTGYNLDCLDAYMRNTEDFEFKPNFNQGFGYYRDNFFENTGIPKFYNNKIYPIDSTAAAQSLLSLSRFDTITKAEGVAEWYIKNMQAHNGAFYYRKHRYYTDKHSFMRWSNAWMLVGLSYLLYKKQGF